MKKMVGVGCLLLAGILGGCSTSDPEKTVFISNGEKMKHDDRLPVQRVWKDPSAVMSRYHKLIIKDVRTDLKLEQSWLERNGIRALLGKEDKDLQELAVYMKKSFSDAVRNHNCRMTLTDKPAPDAVVLEIAIVKVVGNKPVLDVGTTVGAAVLRPISLCLIPVKSVVSKETKSPLCAYLAMEGKVKDSVTGKDLVLFTMGNYEKAALIDVNKLTSTYANVREIIDRWSLLLVEVINKRPLETGKPVPEKEEGAHGYSILKL